MAEGSFLKDEFRCSICLDLLKNPVTVPCGHTYCMRCITDCWDQEHHGGIYRCPQCRETFSPRPVLGKNTMLADVIEKLKKTKLQSTVPAHCYAEYGDVECDVCTGRKLKAIKSCLMCLNSYCQTHLDQHETFFRGKRHNLIEATGQLQEMICSRHDKMMEIYCHTDQRCICMLCMVDEHRNHDTVSTAAARTEKQSQLGKTQNEVHQIIQEREKDLQMLRETVDSYKRSAQTAVEDCEMMFTQLISEVTQLIRDQEKTAVSRAEGLLEGLKREIEDLKRKDAAIKTLSQTQDHIQFLQSFQSLSLSGSTENINITPDVSFDALVKSVAHFREKLQRFCREEMKKISVTNTQMSLTPEPKNRSEFLQCPLLNFIEELDMLLSSFPEDGSPLILLRDFNIHLEKPYAVDFHTLASPPLPLTGFHQFKLDPNTVHYKIKLSEWNQAGTLVTSRQTYVDHPDRFDHWFEVLCTEGVSGRCYWEVEWSGQGKLGVDIAVAYKSMSRKGKGLECVAGRNDQSWSLFCSPSYYSFFHNNMKTIVSLKLTSRRVGVYVDHSAGVLSFYSVSDTMTLIHRVQTTFTQPLYPLIGLDERTAFRLSSNIINDIEILQIAFCSY